MAKIIVRKVTKEDKTQKGTRFWECIGTIDGEIDSFKVWDEPQPGVEFEGEVKDNDKYGKSISTKGVSGGRRYERDPEIGNQIMRQNALTNAVDVMTKVATLTFESGKDKEKALAEAKDMLRPAKIILIANAFFHYSAGHLATGASTPAPQAAAPAAPAPSPAETAAAQAFPEAVDQLDDPAPAKGQDVPPTDIPF